MNVDCKGCRHYQPPKHHELVGYCLRTHPHKVAWDERDNGECGKDGKHYEEAQGELFYEKTVYRNAK